MLLMPLSLPAGTGKVPYQFTTLGQATTEFSKPLDTSGLFKNNPGTCLFLIPPLSLPQWAGGILWGFTATSTVFWFLLPRAPWNKDGCSTAMPGSPSPGLLPAAQGWLPGSPSPIPILTSFMAGWHGIFFPGMEK